MYINELQMPSIHIDNAIITLGDINDSQKGRHFKSRFIQPGLAGYPNQFGNVLITKETLDKFVATLIGKPVIINHKDEITEDDKVGEVEQVWFNPEDGWFWCSGYLTDETAINLIKDKHWSVSCSYDVLLLDDEGGTENNVKYDQEFLNGVFTHLAIVENPRYERANIVVNSKTQIVNGNPDQPRVPKGNPNGGQFAKKEGGNIGQLSVKKEEDYLKNDKVYDSFINVHSSKNLIENAPPVYEGETLGEICEALNKSNITYKTWEPADGYSKEEKIADFGKAGAQIWAKDYDGNWHSLYLKDDEGPEKGTIEKVKNGLLEIINNCKPETEEDLQILKGLKDILEKE